jgi:hypothetical protein
MGFRLLGPLEVADDERALALGGVTQHSLAALMPVHATEVVGRRATDRRVVGRCAAGDAGESIQSCVLRSRCELGASG